MTVRTDPFRALVADTSTDRPVREVRRLTADDLGELGDGDLLVEVEWSGVNYKDGLASSPEGRVARLDVLVPGIDLAGRVVQGAGAGLGVGDAVVVHGNGLGVSHHGGFAQLAQVPAEWAVPLPAGLTARDAMVLGTAGYTAALSIQRLEQAGLTPGSGPVLVTGATGGVGSSAVAMLAGLGYEVVASTGKADAGAWLERLGATEIIGRDETGAAAKPLQRERWAGAVDCVGGGTLEYVLSSLRYGASVAACGNTGGAALSSTVFPFILRGVSLLGIDSVQCSRELRAALWQRMAADLRPRDLDLIGTAEVTLDGLTGALDDVLAGGMRGRTVVRIGA